MPRAKKMKPLAPEHVYDDYTVTPDRVKSFADDDEQVQLLVLAHLRAVSSVASPELLLGLITAGFAYMAILFAIFVSGPVSKSDDKQIRTWLPFVAAWRTVPYGPRSLIEMATLCLVVVGLLFYLHRMTSRASRQRAIALVWLDAYQMEIARRTAMEAAVAAQPTRNRSTSSAEVSRRRAPASNR